jgi:bacterioferritin-associated ferredoxin
MIVCSCNVLSDKQIEAVLLSKVRPSKISQVYVCLGCRPKCGQCAATIKQIRDELRVSQ